MRAIVLIVFIGCLILAFLPLMMEEPEICIGSEMQYFQMNKCVKYNGDPDHRVCESDGMRLYFNMSGEDNLTETEIDSLAREL